MATQANNSSMQYVSFFPRLIAFLIDGVIIAIIGAGIAAITGGTAPDANGNINLTVGNNVGFLIMAVYFIGFWGAKSTSPGKMVMGLKIVDAQGNPLSWSKAAIRLIGYCLSSLILCIGFILIAFDSKKQGLHDKIAGTFVVRK